MGSMQVGAKWNAGSASDGEPSLGRRAALLGASALKTTGAVAGVVCATIVVAALAWQAWSGAAQAVREHKAKTTIEAMRAEQAFLIAKGLATRRFIGVLPSEEAGDFSMSGRKTYQGVAHFVAGTSMDASMGTRVAAILLKPLGLPALVDDSYAISAGEAASQAILRRSPEYVYRHEEAHARAAERGLAFGGAKGWSPEAAKISKFAMGDAAADHAGAWRGKLLSTLWSEAFADARACLAAASHGSGALAACAIDVHGFRIFLDKEDPGVYTSLAILGNSHNVDMASFISGQFDEAAVASLSAEGLDDLSGKVADASVAWFLAREAPGLAFFEGEGRSWWQASARKAGVGESEAKEAWGELRKALCSKQPDAAFGVFDWRVQGHRFQAKGLSRGLSKWRFDGLGGSLSGSWVVDPEKIEVPQKEASPHARLPEGAGGTNGKNAGSGKAARAEKKESKDQAPKRTSKTNNTFAAALASVSEGNRLEAFSAAARTHADLVQRIAGSKKVRGREAEKLLEWSNALENLAGSKKPPKRREFGL